MRRILILLLAFLASYSSALEVSQLTTIVKKQINTDSATFARKMDWQEYRYSSTLRIPPSLKKLEDCLSPVIISLAAANAINRVSYKVTCDNTVKQHKWSVNIVANINYYMAVATTASSLPRGHSLQPEDIVFREQRIRNNDYYPNVAGLAGKKTKRKLRAGSIIKKKDIIIEYAVIRKSEVSIIFKQDSFSLSTLGIALKSGQLGDLIKVKNKRSGNIITTTVIGKNKVSVESK
ncbi:Flagellar basal body P-ring biosynthesis protein-like protein [Psychromonas ingrahamii 37]|uniref:Flagella basal body P-ring formation protein FlgA n=1 Tax=Psychromonas ingrahamii (strain DSM 17664 / CCUG 51855 / 37) TaxID=357804 RepID=A1T0H6_PSYIN|nr:flagellar basal body P-ring formation chaperone FlgA [Psychromonas ingrahamii]ABM05241.1 Flagellar basal body P-ring biosynthesis protein-like protein [Psychromonas ingrahamii 37]